MNILEGGIIGGHAVILQAGNDLHAVLGHVLLSQRNGNLLGAVVAEVEEEHHIALLDASVNSRVDDGFDKLVGNALVIGLLDGTHHIVALLAHASRKHVIGHLDAIPVVITVHRIIAANNGGHCTSALLAVLSDSCYKALAALGVGVTTIHETVNKHTLQGILLGDVAQGHQVLLRTMNAACACQAHDMQSLAVVTGIGKRVDHLGILHDGTILNALVNLDQILIDHTSATNVQVANLAVTHLSIGQTHVFATGLESAVWIGGAQKVEIRCRSAINSVAMTLGTLAPTV